MFTCTKVRLEAYNTNIPDDGFKDTAVLAIRQHPDTLKPLNYFSIFSFEPSAYCCVLVASKFCDFGGSEQLQKPPELPILSR